MTDVAAQPSLPSPPQVVLDPTAIDPTIDRRVKQASQFLDQITPIKAECYEFWRGKQYVYRTKENALQEQSVNVGTGKPAHRVRMVRNMILPIVRHEVSYATQRVPSYQVVPSTGDPQDVSAAAVSQQVAYYGYDEWNIQKKTEGVVTHAVVGGEGFAWPYWDSGVGPFTTGPDGNAVGRGEVRIEVLAATEVAWEPGKKFDDARWYVVRRAKGLDSVKEMPGYLGGELVADARQVGAKNDLNPMTSFVMVTDYLERPCPRYPKGRRMTVANGRKILPDDAYPYFDKKGEVVDEPVLHALAYIYDPEQDRDLGLVEHMVDPQRTINDCTNKQIEWKNMALVPQWIAPFGSMSKRTRMTDIPGAITYYHPVAGFKPEPRVTPAIPSELTEFKQQALGDMQMLAAQTAFANEQSGKAMQVQIEADANARQSYLARLATFHSRLMRHCLTLVACYYTEPRLLKINGKYGPSVLEDFEGADLRSQVDVTVFPDSIAPRTRQELERRVMGFADRGWIPPEKAMAAIEQGTAADLVDSYELDVARANRVLQKIVAGPENFLNAQTVPGPDGAEVPDWMPRPQDNLVVHRSVFEDFSKTVAYDDSDPLTKECVTLYLQGLDYLEQQKAEKLAIEQAVRAEKLGAANAARGPQQGQPSMPSTQGAADDSPQA